MQGRLTLLFVVAGLVAGCYPQRLTPACSERISRCLQDCPGRDDPVPGRAETGLPTADSRSECERHCHDLCAGQGVRKPDPRKPTPDPDKVLP